MTSPNFKAQFITDTYTVKKYNGKEYENCKTNIIEFDRKNISDKNALENINNNWDGKYDENIFDDFC